ncbi:hypothetical protein CSKR_111048 [Clonorchis sinensis]|uniref:Uncharacterized protein n=1 Tax=Clonorchis sinensis TaxID=79923 RepID=A0A3R7HA34_CLOSI|nr:hypothetical protein CSKR_111048 [Clonorchis sinensis]
MSPAARAFLRLPRHLSRPPSGRIQGRLHPVSVESLQCHQLTPVGLQSTTIATSSKSSRKLRISPSSKGRDHRTFIRILVTAPKEMMKALCCEVQSPNFREPKFQQISEIHSFANIFNFERGSSGIQLNPLFLRTGGNWYRSAT